jgi:hypothetical protein
VVGDREYQGVKGASAEQRFWSKVQIGPGCWLWLGGTDTSGYGVFYYVGRPLRAHRYSIELAGRIIPSDRVVDHVCRTRACVNPAHLRIVTRRENVHENSQAIAHLNSLKTHCAKGHPFSGDNLLIRASGGRVCRACARDRWRAKNAPHLLRENARG